MKTKILAFLFCLLGAGVGIACDVNLVALLSGESPDAGFATMIVRLASETRSVGKNLNTPEVARTNLVQLMKTWMEFDNRFSQKPPEWARSDVQWAAKLKQMATLIGKISESVQGTEGSKESKVHGLIVALSGELTSLFETMPLSKPRQHLRNVSQKISHLIEMKEQNEFAGFPEAVGALADEMVLFQNALGTETAPITLDLAFQVNELKSILASDTTELSQRAVFALLVCEEELAKISAKLNEAKK